MAKGNADKLRDRKLRKIAEARERRIVLFAIIRTGLTHRQAVAVYLALMEYVRDALKGGGRARVRGLGTFYVKGRPELECRDPRNGARVVAAAKRVPVLRFDGRFANAINLADPPQSAMERGRPLKPDAQVTTG